jgi:hypothetical protein
MSNHLPTMAAAAMAANPGTVESNGERQGKIGVCPRTA